MTNFSPTIQIEQIQQILTNFDWKLIKQEITNTEITLIIQKVLVATPFNTSIKPE